MKTTLPLSTLALSLTFILLNLTVSAQCPLPASGFGSGAAPSPGNSAIIETCNFVGEYETVSGVVAGDTYTVNYAQGAGVYVVVYDNTNTPIAWGDTTVQFTAAISALHYSAVFIDSTCNANDPTFSCNSSLWTNVSPAAQLSLLNSLKLSAVPNPTEGLVAISFEGNNAQVLVSDLRGKRVYSGQIKSGEKIDLSAFDVGIYFCHVQIDGRSEIIQIVRQ